MADQVTVVVTRPGAAGSSLADELARRGQPALWLPAFEFGPPPDDARARAVLASVADFDLAIFVSPQAVRATAALLAQPWPAGTVIAAVGAGTRAAVAAIGGSERARLLPEREEDMHGSGSEALWPLLQAMQPLPGRVLLLRAQSGREWLADRLHDAGSSVTPVAVYSRLPCCPSDELRARLAAAVPRGLASVVSSSDAVASLTDALGGQPAVLQALRAGLALASHPRIAERLRSSGFARVVVCAPEAAAILASLREPGVDRP